MKLYYINNRSNSAFSLIRLNSQRLILQCLNEVLNEIMVEKKFKSAFPTAQNMKFSVKGFLSTVEQIRSFLWVCSHIVRKYLTESF